MTMGLFFSILAIILAIGTPVAVLFGGMSFLPSVFDSSFPYSMEYAIRSMLGGLDSFTLLAVPLFVFMGVVLEKSGIAEELLETMGRLFGRIRGGLAISVVMVGALLAATTGVVGASVVTMSVIALPVMLKKGYAPSLASGTIAASGTLGQIIPPSIILILLGDVIGVPVGELFMGAAVPGILLIVAYMVYIAIIAWRKPEMAPAIKANQDETEHLALSVLKSLLPPLALVIAVLGSIFFGVASPTESAAVGALGAMILAAIHRRLSFANLRDALEKTTRLTSMVFIILIGATAFGLVFVGMGGDRLILELFSNLPGGKWSFIILSMLLVFVLGFFLDFIEICFIVVPIIAPVAIHLGLNPLWYALLIALNLQTSFLTPPFGFSLFYLKASAPPELKLQSIYRGIIPFVAIQLLVLAAMIAFPDVGLWLPTHMK